MPVLIIIKHVIYYYIYIINALKGLPITKWDLQLIETSSALVEPPSENHEITTTALPSGMEGAGRMERGLKYI